MKLTSYRLVNLYALLMVVFLLGSAGYLQFAENLAPCPLCVMQRLVFAVIGLCFFAGIVYIPDTKSRKIFNTIILVICIFGIALAGRHVYLQHLPAGAAPACGPGLNFIVKNLPPGEALKMMLTGTGECAKIHWYFLKLSIPEWSLIFYILLGAIAFYQTARQRV